MSCRVVGAHGHQWRKRLRRKILTAMSYGEWAVRKYLTDADMDSIKETLAQDMKPSPKEIAYLSVRSR